MQTFMGLPWHPLFVHFAVSFLCLFALGAVAVISSRRVAQRVGIFFPIFGVVTVLLSVITKQTGEILAESTTDVNWHQHADFADAAVIAAFLLGCACVLLWWLSPATTLFTSHRAVAKIRTQAQRPALYNVLRILILLLAVATLVATFLTGHSGAQLVWME